MWSQNHLGSANPHNVLKALMQGLKSQSSPKFLSTLRGKKFQKLLNKEKIKNET